PADDAPHSRRATPPPPPLPPTPRAPPPNTTRPPAPPHGATGKGNDQVRFELTYMALNPKLKIVSPWKDPAFLDDGLTDRETAIAYAKQHGIAVDQTTKKIYSRDRNLWHISHEGAEIEHPDQEPNWKNCLVMPVPVEKAPAKAQLVKIAFQKGNPVSIDGKKMHGEDLIARLNNIGGQHAVGTTVLTENRLVGMKSRGVYETPGGTILYEAHKALEQLCLERDLWHEKIRLATRYAELVYNGQWFHPLRESLQAFMDHASQVVTGEVTVKLYKGTAMAIEATSPSSLYDADLASFAMDGYDVTAARGFIDLYGLPMQVRGAKQKFKA
ncbi:MAG: argininosuccinate synthase, partial [Planctomycetota bacterium]